jgi:hypothetical protein
MVRIGNESKRVELVACEERKLDSAPVLSSSAVRVVLTDDDLGQHVKGPAEKHT